MSPADSRLVVVPCGSAKVWDKQPGLGAVAARDAYTGAPFVLNREFAERFGTAWVILSAKYGFVHPSDEIPGPYNVTFKRRSTGPVATAALRAQVEQMALGEFDEVVGLGGKEYRAALTCAFQGSGVALRFPFAGLPIGKMLQATRRAIDSGTPGLPPS
jgi:hypothetical protein